MTNSEFKAARLYLGLTQTQLAVELGLAETHKHISAIENGAKLQRQTALAVEHLMTLKRASMHPSNKEFRK